MVVYIVILCQGSDHKMYIWYTISHCYHYGVILCKSTGRRVNISQNNETALFKCALLLCNQQQSSIEEYRRIVVVVNSYRCTKFLCKNWTDLCCMWITSSGWTFGWSYEGILIILFFFFISNTKYFLLFCLESKIMLENINLSTKCFNIVYK